jgi:hypothetical protein
VVTGPDLLDDVRKASDDQLSLFGAIREVLEFRLTRCPVYDCERLGDANRLHDGA